MCYNYLILHDANGKLITTIFPRENKPHLGLNSKQRNGQCENLGSTVECTVRRKNYTAVRFQNTPSLTIHLKKAVPTVAQSFINITRCTFRSPAVIYVHTHSHCVDLSRRFHAIKLSCKEYPLTYIQFRKSATAVLQSWCWFSDTVLSAVLK